jgi:dethiobiotin synthetase
MNIAIVGIHTGIGKTIASAIICEAMMADYWKPVQAGGLDHTDSNEVKALTGFINIHPEAFRLSQPMSPHAAARLDDTKIEIEKILIPHTDNHLVIETAGGLMSPLNDNQTNLDMVRHFNLPVIVVSQHYLGSINHTLLTLSVLRAKGITARGVIFNGEQNPYTEEYILRYAKYLGRIKPLKEVNKNTITEEALRLRPNIQSAFA